MQKCSEKKKKLLKEKRGCTVVGDLCFYKSLDAAELGALGS